MALAYIQGVVTFASPLLLTTTYHHPYLTAVGVALQSYMAKITYTTLADPSQISASLETSAIASLVTTSTVNRTTRALLGLVHVLAGVSLARRSQQDYDATKKDSTVSVVSWHTAWQTVSFAGVLVLFSAAATWISSSYYGQ